MADDDTRFIPGHGDVAGKQDVIAFGDRLAGIRDRIVALIAEGEASRRSWPPIPPGRANRLPGGCVLPTRSCARDAEAMRARR